jgi:hypothetical protein
VYSVLHNEYALGSLYPRLVNSLTLTVYLGVISNSGMMSCVYNKGLFLQTLELAVLSLCPIQYTKHFACIPVYLLLV